MRTFWLLLALFLLAIAGTALYLAYHPIAVLDPKGWVAWKERNLLLIATLLMLLVVIPVFILTPLFSIKFRFTNKRAKYSPDWDKSHAIEAIWWGVPCAIILVLSILGWKESRTLDPFTPLPHEEKPLTIQVVALQWRWLFLYPEQGVATLNLLRFPEKRPLHFEISADAPMNSFWIPQLGGQVFAMPKMKTQLHLIAQEPGSFRGSSANISGEGFANMHFLAVATSPQEFDEWIHEMQTSGNKLNLLTYSDIRKPSQETSPQVYRLEEEDLFHQIMRHYP